MVGDPGIEPGVRLREGSYSPLPHLAACRPHAQAHCAEQWGVITSAHMGRQDQNALINDDISDGAR